MKELLKNLADETVEFIWYELDNMIIACLIYAIFSIPGVILVCALYHSTAFVDWQYSTLHTGEWSVKFGQMNSEEYIEWANDQEWAWAMSQVLYGDYYAATCRAINEQILAEKRGEHLQTINVLGRKGWYSFDAYDLGKDESEYNWHNGESYVSLPITN